MNNFISMFSSFHHTMMTESGRRGPALNGLARRLFASGKEEDVFREQPIQPRRRLSTGIGFSIEKAAT